MVETRPSGRCLLLIVDDFPEWRMRVRKILQERLDWTVVGEASDGSEAVEKAAQLRPDVIILDLGMPRMNGLEAAKLIRRNSPSTAIVFLSENTDPDIQHAALRIGNAYVLKRTAKTALISAIEAAQAAAAVSAQDESDSLNSRT